ncbi:MAG: copper homeostasis protein CutC [Sphingobium sp.]
MPTKLLEICVETMADMATAIRGGAGRIELCSALALGGLTPSAGLAGLAVRQARSSRTPVHAMVRPRDGDFAYDRQELEMAVAEGIALIDAGVDGLVFGAARDGRLDTEVMALWCKAVRARRVDISLTLHRAIDLVADPVAAVDDAVALGFHHILSSGGAQVATDALPVLAAMQARAAGHLAVMPGSGVRSSNVAAVLAATGTAEVHSSASIAAQAVDDRALAMGFALGARRRTSLEEVRALRAALDR